MKASGSERIDEQIDRIDIGEALEERGLAFHHRLCSQRAEIAQAKNGGAVRYDGDEIALARIGIGVARIFRDRLNRNCNTRRIGER